MTTATITSAATLGIDGFPVEVRVTINNGLPSVSVVGLTHGAGRETRDRIFPALASQGFKVPLKQIVIECHPAELRKDGNVLDLAIALAVLKASGQHTDLDTANTCFLGELGLEGDVRHVRGTLSMAMAARANGIQRIVVPHGNALEAACVEGITVIPVRSLSDAIHCLMVEPSKCPTVRFNASVELHDGTEDVVDFADVRAQPLAKRALEIAAAGGHNVLLIGPPGAGKTMLARRLPTILPKMNVHQAIEVTKIASVAGLMAPGVGLVKHRPFRAPHHTISDAGIVGGGSNPRPGEVSLSHRGVLFLDELPEFRKNVLDVLKAPMADKQVTLSRAAVSLTYPADFILLAAMNPCPCGWEGDPVRKCRCGNGAAYYRQRVANTLPWFDIIVTLPAVAWQDLTESATGESSAAIRRRVVDARVRQSMRYPGEALSYTNSGMTAKQIRWHCKVNEETEEFLRQAIVKGGLSAKQYQKVLKVARTIADLAYSDELKVEHVVEALWYQEYPTFTKEIV